MGVRGQKNVCRLSVALVPAPKRRQAWKPSDTKKAMLSEKKTLRGGQASEEGKALLSAELRRLAELKPRISKRYQFMVAERDLKNSGLKGSMGLGILSSQLLK